MLGHSIIPDTVTGFHQLRNNIAGSSIPHSVGIVCLVMRDLLARPKAVSFTIFVFRIISFFLSYLKGNVFSELFYLQYNADNGHVIYRKQPRLLY